jgi:NADPH2:quinone reductase
MRVIQVTRFGGPEVLAPRQAPDPGAATGQVVVDVAAADVLFVETQIRRGSVRGYFELTPPYVPGGGVAGRVRVGAPGDRWHRA